MTANNGPSDLQVFNVLRGRPEKSGRSRSASPSTRVLSVGDVLVLPPGLRCRAYRWPRDASQATVFVAAYPDGPDHAPLATPHA